MDTNLLALKVRSEILKEYRGQNEASYKACFLTLTKEESKYADKELFHDFVEDKVDENVPDISSIYNAFDVDGDGKISQTDFLNFILGQSAEAFKALDTGNLEVIVDVRVSSNTSSDNEFALMGYEQLKPQDVKSAELAMSGSFGKGQSLWVWRKKNGTCLGRLKPIIDMQLDQNNVSSAFVISGYTCLPTSIAGQWLWIKRASTEEEEKDSIVELHITQGKSKIPSDKIWSGPGVGWIRIDGNFSYSTFSILSNDSFVWIRPLRNRSLETSSPLRMAVGLTEEAKFSKMAVSIRICLRNYVPHDIIAKLSITSKAKDVPDTATRSDAIYDFASIYHKFDSSLKGRVSQRQFIHLLYDVGLRIDKVDFTQCFKFFNTKQDGYITREEYCRALTLTEYEVDVLADKLRLRLLAGVSSSSATLDKETANSLKSIPISTMQPSNTGSVFAPIRVVHGKNKLREGRTFGQIFNMINCNKDGILSTDEMRAFCSMLDIYVTDEEIMKIIKMMDVDGDDRIEERDFVAFMKKDSDSYLKKAYRLRESAATLRRWLIRGTNPLSPGRENRGDETVLISDRQWLIFKNRHESMTGYIAHDRPFPGYLDSTDIFDIMDMLGCRLSFLEARELVGVIAPEKNGRVYREDLQRFMARSCRSFGELIAIITRDHLKSLFDAYKAYRACGLNSTNNSNNNQKSSELFDNYEQKVVEIVKIIQTVNVRSTNPDSFAAPKANASEIVSLMQLKTGIESLLRGQFQQGFLHINLEEWGCLASLFQSNIAEEDTYGINARDFLVGSCNYVIGSLTDFSNTKLLTADTLSKELRLMIMDEAKGNRKSTAAGAVVDYLPVFNLFDTNSSGSVTLEELQSMLNKMKLLDNLPDNQIPVLLSKFDKEKKGYFTYKDFVSFVEESRSKDQGSILPGDNDNDEFAFDDDDVGDEDDLYSTLPPSNVTKDSDCNWLLWHIWKQATRICLNSNPESVISELQSRCSEAELVQHHGNVTVREMKSILKDLKLYSNLSDAQFNKGIKILVFEGTGADFSSLEIDFESFCKYVIRMGRIFRSQRNDRKAVDQKKYLELRRELKKELTTNYGAAGTSNIPKFEKVFRRFDTDNDGKISMQEFKLGLKKIKMIGQEQWTRSMVKQLFAEMDSNKDYYISIKELSQFVQDTSADSSGTIAGSVVLDKKPDSRVLNSDLDDPSDTQVVTKKAVNIDAKVLYSKVTNILLETISEKELKGATSTEERVDVVRRWCRKFFEKYNVISETEGFVSLDVYRAFLRKSGLQEQLTVGEHRFLTDKLRRQKSAVKSGSSSNDAAAIVDYKTLIDEIIRVPVDGSGNYSRGDSLFLKLQDAVSNAHTTGKAFMDICELMDSSSSGVISMEDFLYVTKVVGCPLGKEDLSLLFDSIPSYVKTSGNNINYRDLNQVLLEFTPRADVLDASYFNPNMSGYPSSMKVNRSFLGTASRLDLSQTSSPYVGARAGGMNSTAGKGGNRGYDLERKDFATGRPNSGSVSANPERVVQALGSRIRIAIEDKNQQRGVSYNLNRHFDAYSGSDAQFGPNYLHIRVISGALKDLGVHLSSAESSALVALFGHYDDDEFIDYSQFLATIDPDQLYSGVGVSDSRRGGSRGKSDTQQFDRSTGLSSSSSSSYTNPRVISNLRELQLDGYDLRKLFEVKDFNQSGMVTVKVFKDIVSRMKLFQNDVQMSKAAEDFAWVSDRSMFLYEDFCGTLEMLMDSRGVAGGIGINSGRDDDFRRPTASNNNRSSYDGPVSNRRDVGDDDNDMWFRSQSGRGAVGSARLQTVRSSRDREFFNDLDDGSVYERRTNAGHLSPPKVSDSWYTDNSRRAGQGGRGRYGSSTEFSHDDSSAPIVRSSYSNPGRSSMSGQTSPKRPPMSASRHSPSRMGSKLWGSDTPLSKKGLAPKLDDSSWICAVCMYTENKAGAKSCDICDTPNFAIQKEFQVKEQCANCTFINGSFAETCAMCGQGLSRRSKP